MRFIITASLFTLAACQSESPEQPDVNVYVDVNLPEQEADVPEDTGLPVEDSCDHIYVWYFDADGDGFGASSVNSDTWSCDPVNPPGPGYVDVAGDCDDTLSWIHPDAQEICDEFDNDCDGLVNSEDPSVTGEHIWFPDNDGDGYGDGSAQYVRECFAPSGMTTNHTDCDDSDPSIHPDAADQPDDGIDSDCDGTVETVSGDMEVMFDGPNPGYMHAGDSEVALHTTTWQPTWEDMFVEELNYRIDGDMSIVDGIELVYEHSSGVTYLGGTWNTSGNVTFYPGIEIPMNDPKTLTLSVSISDAASSGDVLTATLLTTDSSVVGEVSGEMLQEDDFTPGSNIVGNDQMIVSSCAYPAWSDTDGDVTIDTTAVVYTASGSPAGSVAPGYQEVLRFNVAVPHGCNDLQINGLDIGFMATDYAGTGWAADMLDVGVDVYNLSTGGTSEVAFDQVSFSGTLTDGTVELAGSEYVPIGSTYTFAVYADLTGASISMDDRARFDLLVDSIWFTNGDGDTITVVHESAPGDWLQL